jgi:hypothetical protein
MIQPERRRQANAPSNEASDGLASSLPAPKRLFFKDEKSEPALQALLGASGGIRIAVGLWDARDDGIYLRSGDEAHHRMFEDEGIPGIMAAKRVLSPEIYGFGIALEGAKAMVTPRTGDFDKHIPPSHKDRFEALMRRLLGREDIAFVQDYARGGLDAGP